MPLTKKKPYWNNTRVAILSSFLTSATLITVALINGNLKKCQCPEASPEVQKSVSNNYLDTGTQNNTLNQIKQENKNTGDVNTDVVSGNKEVHNSFVEKKEIKAKNVVAGNNYGQNGDVLNEPELTDNLKKEIISKLKTFAKRNHLEHWNHISIYKTNNSNCRKLIFEVEKLLSDTGYILPNYSSINSIRDFEGYKIEIGPEDSNSFVIIFGIMPPSK